MTPSAKLPLLGVALLLLLTLLSVGSADERPRPKTVRQLITTLGKSGKDTEHLRLKIEGKAEGEDIGSLPKEMLVNLLYDKPGGRVLVEINSVYADGKKSKITTYSDVKQAARWIGTPGEKGLQVQALEPTVTLPNPWSIPPMLTFPGLFADWAQGYEALGREFSRSKRLNREPDENGRVSYRLNPSPSASPAMRNQIEAGMEVVAGFDSETGMMQTLTVQHNEPKAVVTLRVVEQSKELSKEELESFGIPDEVMELILNPPKRPKPLKDPFARTEKESGKNSKTDK